MIKRFKVDFSTIVDTGSVCSSPTITYHLPQSLTVPCSDSTSVDIEINTDVAGPHCLTFIVDCSSSCSTCGPIEITKCFCVDADDCGGCENCTGNLCVSTCAEGKICDNDTCVDCTSDTDCLCNQVCSQGGCKCEGGLKKRADGCCVECFDGEDLGNCRICIGGIIVAIDCPDGYCNPNDGNCQECYNNSHCTAPNECCNAYGICDCCPGYILDPATNQCVPEPPCLNAQFCIDHYGPCYYCGPDGCTPIICPAGQVCDPTTGECVPECGVCPEGSGCINGMCVPCSQLSCTGEGLQCQYADGCECEGTTCEYVNCSPDTVQLDWVVTTGTPGTLIPGTGLPSLSGTTSISPLAMVYLQPPSGSGFYNHQFNLAVTNATSGTWTLTHAGGSVQSLGSGLSVSFDLQSTGPDLFGFVVKFTETGTGRTATWGIYRTPGSSLDAPNVWNYEFQSTGSAPQTTGGTSGSVALCANNGNFTPTGVTNVTTTGTISITFFPDGTGCLIASISGCGLWNGDVILSCGGQTITVPAPEFFKDPANCCEPTDPNCAGWGDGDPCGDLTIQNIPLLASPTFGQAPSGDGEFFIEADFASIGLSFLDFFYLNITSGCWSTANNPLSTSNDIAIVTSAGQSPFGPSVSSHTVFATMGDGGCVRLGHNCVLQISGCKKLQGEVCLTECTAFKVNIVNSGTNTYTAVPSLNDEVVTYVWTYPGLLNTTGQTVTITPVGGSSTLIVTAKYGTPVKCTASDSLLLNTTVAGCTNTQACNYNSAANIDDSSCLLIGNPSYDCTLGGFQPGIVTASHSSLTLPAIVWKIGGVAKVANEQITPGTHTLDVFFDGVQKCSRTLVVPQCYRCDASDTCIPAPAGSNSGIYTTADCDGACNCDIEINVSAACNNNRTALTISATGDTGTYTVTVNEVGGAEVLSLTSFSTGTVTTPLLCNGTYRILVTGANCDHSVDYTTSCFNCASSTAALSSVSYDCNTNQLNFSITQDPCADWYNVKLLTAGLVVKTNNTYTTAGAKAVSVGTYPGDGSYIVRLTTSDGCVRDILITLNCDGTLSACPIDTVTLNYTDDGTNIDFIAGFSLSEAGGAYTVTLYSTTGGGQSNCIAAVPAAQISQQTVTGALGSNIVNFPNAVSTPGIGTCYAVTVQRLGSGYGDCNETATKLVVPTGPAQNCNGTVTNLSYDTATGNILTSWNFNATSNNLTVEVRVSATPCSGSDPIVVSVSGNGEDGTNIPFGPVHQLPGVAQCATVRVYDTNDPTCYDEDTIEIAACTCDVDIVSVEIDSVAETAEVTYTSRCTTAGDLVIDISGVATGSATDATGSENGVVVTNTKIVALTGYPSTGGNITTELSDNADAGCVDTQVTVLPSNCVSCAQVASLYLNTSTVTTIRNHAGVIVVTGSYDVIADEALLESTTETEITSDGGNFCPDATPVDVSNTRLAGIAVNQDNTDFQKLDHVVITSPDFVGSLKSYFGTCGCATNRVCDYTVALPISATATSIVFRYATNNLAADYTGELSIDIDVAQTFSASALAAIEADIYSVLTGTSCNSTVSSVDATYDSGTDILTIIVAGTNAGIGIINTLQASSIGSISDFTQSGCV